MRPVKIFVQLDDSTGRSADPLGDRFDRMRWRVNLEAAFSVP
jgi:hypothetical protein